MTASTSPSPPPPPVAIPLSPNQVALGRVQQFPRTWVPLASAFELDPDRPTPIKFMGQRYVAYRSSSSSNDADGQVGERWVVTDDACPHRLAPLSEGRIDRNSNVLECAYHGWKFSDDGYCQRIPQMTPEAQTAAFRNPKCHLKSYPTVLEKNVVWAWLWPDDPFGTTAGAGDADNADQQQQQRLSGFPEYMAAGVLDNSSTYTRDLPYGWDTLMENIVDPAHVPFAHHGMQGKRTDAIPINMTFPLTVDRQGFRFEFDDRTMGMVRRGSGVFRAPYVIQYEGGFEPKPGADPDAPPPVFNLTTILIPTEPGWSRIIIFSGQTRRQDEKDKEKSTSSASPTKEERREKKKRKKRRKKSLLQRVFGVTPVWALHQLSNRFLDSDLAFLHFQEQERQRRRQSGMNMAAGLTRSRPNGGASSAPYFMPAQSDRCVSALRKWVDSYAVVPGPLPPAIDDRSQLFNRHAQHTDQCKYCAGALEGIKRWRTNSYRILALSIVLSRYTTARVVAVGCLLALRILASLEPSFRVGGFKHYENH